MEQFLAAGCRFAHESIVTHPFSPSWGFSFSSTHFGVVERFSFREILSRIRCRPSSDTRSRLSWRLPPDLKFSGVGLTAFRPIRAIFKRLFAAATCLLRRCLRARVREFVLISLRLMDQPKPTRRHPRQPCNRPSSERRRFHNARG